MIVSDLKHQHLQNGAKAYFATYALLALFALTIYIFKPIEYTIYVDPPIPDKIGLTEVVFDTPKPPSPPSSQSSEPSRPPKVPQSSNAGLSSTAIATPEISDNLKGVNDSLISDELDKLIEQEIISTNVLASNDLNSNINGFGIPTNGNTNLGIESPGVEIVDDYDIMNDDNVFIAVDKEPELDYDNLYAKLEYPSIAVRNGIEGQVLISVLVGKDGKPIKFIEKGESNPIFRKAAIEAVMNANFSPALQGDEPVLCWVTIPITFKLK